jgi:hypothetical protein
MKSTESGKSTSGVELSTVSPDGLWLLIDGRKHYLAFEHFPWFRHATIGQLGVIERPSSDHLHWPELDIDLSLESIERPEEFPLVSRSRA